MSWLGNLLNIIRHRLGERQRQADLRDLYALAPFLNQRVGDDKKLHRQIEDSLLMMTHAGHLFGEIEELPPGDQSGRLVQAMKDDNPILAGMSAEKLASSGRMDSLPGLVWGLGSSDLVDNIRNGILQGLQEGKGEPGWHAAIYEALWPHVLEAVAHGGKSDLTAVLLRMDPAAAAAALFETASHSRMPLSVDLLIEMADATGFRLPVQMLEDFAEALLPHRRGLPTGLAWDAAISALVTAGGQGRSLEVQAAVAAESARRADAAQGMRSGSSRAFLRISQSRLPDDSKVSALHSALDSRFKRLGLQVGYNEDREFELRHMTRPEWIIRTLNCFFCGCENSGSLARCAEQGVLLVEEMDEVGLPGCAGALRTIRPLYEELLRMEQPGDVDSEEQVVEDADDDPKYAALQEQIEQAEAASRAEGYEDCCAALWRYAILYQDQILAVE